MAIEPLLFNVRTAAEYLGISERQVEEYIAQGRFKIVKLPDGEGGLLRRRLIRREDLQQFVRKEAQEC